MCGQNAIHQQNDTRSGNGLAGAWTESRPIQNGVPLKIGWGMCRSSDGYSQPHMISSRSEQTFFNINLLLSGSSQHLMTFYHAFWIKSMFVFAKNATFMFGLDFVADYRNKIQDSATAESKARSTVNRWLIWQTYR